MRERRAAPDLSAPAIRSRSQIRGGAASARIENMRLLAPLCLGVDSYIHHFPYSLPSRIADASRWAWGYIWAAAW